jgi:plastocyanin
MKYCAPLLAALLFAGCTPGAITPSASSSGGAGVTTIDVNLTQHPDGYAPNVTTVAVGSSIRFVNTDGFAHTATAIPGATTFPAGSPFTASAQSQSGSAVSQAWSSGTLAAGASSQTILIDRAGTYLYGCFYHYGSPMRGTIVAQ